MKIDTEVKLIDPEKNSLLEDSNKIMNDIASKIQKVDFA
jgi:hypothetical protein